MLCFEVPSQKPTCWGVSIYSTTVGQRWPHLLQLSLPLLQLPSCGKGQKFPSRAQVHKPLCLGGVPGPCCGLLTSTIHMYFDLFSPEYNPEQTEYNLPLAGPQAAWLPGLCTLTVYCSLKQQPPPADPSLLGHSASLLGQHTLVCLQLPPLRQQPCCFDYYGFIVYGMRWHEHFLR